MNHNIRFKIKWICFKCSNGFYSNQDLRYLKTLLLNHNSIAFIELDAFSSLTALRSVNLTSNRLEKFDNQIFEKNSRILSVDLSDNNFMYLENQPIIRSVSLEVCLCIYHGIILIELKSFGMD